MLRYELTPNNAGFILWGDSEALNELHELIHYIVDESPLIKVKDGFMLSLAYDIRKAREGNRRVEQHQYDQHDTYKLYGVELLWPLVLVQSSILSGLAPIFPDTFYRLTHYWFAAADIPVANDIPVHCADAIRCNVRRPPQGSLPLLTRQVLA